MSKRQLLLAGLLRGETFTNLEAQARCQYMTYVSQQSGDLRNDEGWPTESKKIKPEHPARFHFMNFSRLAEMVGTDEGTVRQVAEALAPRVPEFNCVGDFVGAAQKMLALRVARQMDLFTQIARGQW
jgi:hypothetical protein